MGTKRAMHRIRQTSTLFLEKNKQDWQMPAQTNTTQREDPNY